MTALPYFLTARPNVYGTAVAPGTAPPGSRPRMSRTGRRLRPRTSAADRAARDMESEHGCDRASGDRPVPVPRGPGRGVQALVRGVHGDRPHPGHRDAAV